nr:HAD-IC family P-type ATPase [Candidatus Sigynarchaeota archaeon]
FAPIVILIAAGTWTLTQNIFYTISVLLVACPCALAISVPTAFIGALGNAAKRGIWFKSGKTIEDAGRVNTLVIDKTGTLTFGLPTITAITPRGETRQDELERIVYSIEARSNHPVGKSITNALSAREYALVSVDDFSIIPSLGVSAVIPDKGRVFIGNDELLNNEGPRSVDGIEKPMMSPRTSWPYALHVFTKDKMLGEIEFGEHAKEGLDAAVDRMRRDGLTNIVLMTGDAEKPARYMGKLIGADLVYSRATPNDKATFIKDARAHGAIVAMAGDGINDAPALALADVGIAMGKEGTALAVQQANIVVMDDDVTKIRYIFALGKKCVGKARANIMLAIMFNVIGILLSAMGFIIPIIAALYHIIQSLTVVGNAALFLRDVK